MFICVIYLLIVVRVAFGKQCLVYVMLSNLRVRVLFSLLSQCTKHFDILISYV